MTIFFRLWLGSRHAAFFGVHQGIFSKSSPIATRNDLTFSNYFSLLFSKQLNFTAGVADSSYVVMAQLSCKQPGFDYRLPMGTF